MKILIFIFAFIFLLAGCEDGYETWPNVIFEQKNWLGAKPEERFVFAKDLINGKRLIGKTRSEVYIMLGKPSFDDPRNHRITYTLKSGQMDSYFLDIRFDYDKPLPSVKEAFVASQ